MARKDAPPDGPADTQAAALQKFRVYGTVGHFADGDIVTTADLFPGVEDQADIDALTRRLLGFSALAPVVEFATPEPPAAAPEDIRPTPVVHADHPEVAAGAVTGPSTPPTFTVPVFKPAKANDAK